MLLRHVSGYFVSTAVQLLASVVLLALLTRWLSPQDYGRYALGITVIQIVGGPLFHWIRAIVGRFLVNADIAGRRGNLIVTTKHAMIGCSLAVFTVMLGIELTGVFDHGFALLLRSILPAMIAQAFFQIQTDIHRAELRLKRCAILLIAQSIGGVVLSLIFVAVLHQEAAGAVSGITVSCLLCLIADYAYSPLRAQGDKLEWRDLRVMLAYSLPLTAIMAFEMILQSGDRFLIAGLLSDDAVAAYAAPQILASRSIQNLCIVVASSSLPLIIATFEREGAAATKLRYKQAGELMMLALIPTTVAIVAMAGPITDLLIGPALRDQARRILPVVALATVLNGLASHYLAHGFQVARRTMIEIWAILPAAILGVILDIVFLPRYGVVAAGYALLFAQLMYVALSWLLVRRFFDVPVPLWASLRILIPCLIAGGLIKGLALPSTPAGLALGIGIIVAFTGVGVLFSDVGGIRHALLRQRLKT